MIVERTTAKWNRINTFSMVAKHTRTDNEKSRAHTTVSLPSNERLRGESMRGCDATRLKIFFPLVFDTDEEEKVGAMFFPHIFFLLLCRHPFCRRQLFSPSFIPIHRRCQ